MSHARPLRRLATVLSGLAIAATTIATSRVPEPLDGGAVAPGTVDDAGPDDAGPPGWNRPFSLSGGASATETVELRLWIGAPARAASEEGSVTARVASANPDATFRVVDRDGVIDTGPRPVEAAVAVADGGAAEPTDAGAGTASDAGVPEPAPAEGSVTLGWDTLASACPAEGNCVLLLSIEVDGSAAWDWTFSGSFGASHGADPGDALTVGIRE
jgi:hypothetical protein